MIIWAGWGVLAFLLPAGGAALFVGLGTLIGLDDSSGAQVMAGLGLVVGSIATWFLGRWFNEQRPITLTETVVAARRQELDHLVATRQFQYAPGYPAPSSHDEARAQADHLLAAEAAALQKRARNRHTLFWVPMQYMAFLTGAIGLVILVMGMM
ncbi:hypothetical protein IPV09_01560 [Tessaracoccus sp. SD287]|uniref:hypothetical protein n=1 Tax=Tessaracoccus sp. SD287 TaxID=2782008 RepID=UPI001A977E7F|nr:hypothetical protein [Tessaracoccus sp. SD287]MBO1030018.1 hypothetical protein [Tessaracoccus sp. SD287]